MQHHIEEDHGGDNDDSFDETELELEFEEFLIRTDDLAKTTTHTSLPLLGRSKAGPIRIASKEVPIAPLRVETPTCIPINQLRRDSDVGSYDMESRNFKDLSVAISPEEDFDYEADGRAQPSPGSAQEIDARERRFKCPVPGCGKAYKNLNGLKYHAAHGHCENDSEDKRFRCPHQGCHKRYKNANGLKYHLAHAHVRPNLSFV